MNVLDWSINNNIGIALGQKTYLWNYPTQKLHEIHEFNESDNPTSLCFDLYSEIIAMGTMNGQVMLIDPYTQKKIIDFKQHDSRIATISLANNKMLTGSRDNTIKLFDL